MTVETLVKKAKCTPLEKYCHFSKPEDYIEITEWTNAEGFDVDISGKEKFSLTWGQWECLQMLVNYRD